jgi:hypothetical protein
MEEAYAIIAGDELTSLKEAKCSPDWPEWEKAMKIELDLLSKKGTWELVQKPSDTVPISNKWVFIKKTEQGRRSNQISSKTSCEGMCPTTWI